jgi:hypothetical protein
MPGSGCGLLCAMSNHNISDAVNRPVWKELACVACSMSLQTVMLQPVKKPAFFIYNIIVCYCDDYDRYYQVHDAFKGMSLP